jgi:hypothetical protein
VKKTGRDEPIGIVIHICMETVEGISLYSYLYFKLAKPPYSLIIFYVSSTKLENRRVEQVLPGGGELLALVGGVGGRERGRRMNMV